MAENPLPSISTRSSRCTMRCIGQRSIAACTIARELRFIALEKRQSAVGEHDTESVGRPFGILLGDLDPPGRIAALGEQREQETGRSGPDYGGAHLMTASYFTGRPGCAYDCVIVHEIPRGLA